MKAQDKLCVLADEFHIHGGDTFYTHNLNAAMFLWKSGGYLSRLRDIEDVLGYLCGFEYVDAASAWPWEREIDGHVVINGVLKATGVDSRAIKQALHWLMVDAAERLLETNTGLVWLSPGSYFVYVVSELGGWCRIPKQAVYQLASLQLQETVEANTVRLSKEYDQLTGETMLATLTDRLQEGAATQYRPSSTRAHRWSEVLAEGFGRLMEALSAMAVFLRRSPLPANSLTVTRYMNDDWTPPDLFSNVDWVEVEAAFDYVLHRARIYESPGEAYCDAGLWQAARWWKQATATRLESDCFFENDTDDDDTWSVPGTGWTLE